MDIAEILTRNEDKTLEFKRDLSSPDKVLQTLVSFANTAGGLLIIGVDNQTKNVRGIPDPLLEEERLANLISDRIAPRLIPTVDIVSWRGSQLIVIEVYPSPSRPYYLKSLGLEQGVFVRIGSTNRRADDVLIQEMRRMANNQTFDEEPLPELNSEALDFRVASELFTKRPKMSKAEWQTLRVLVKQGRNLVPSIGGLLLFGKRPSERFPDAWIQCGRFHGKTKTEIKDSVECQGPLPQALEMAYAFVTRHVERGMIIIDLKRNDTTSIPLGAVRELLVNAVVHADYAQRGAPIRLSLFDDRIEIENPGILLTGLTIDDIQCGVSRLRNRVIGRVFKELGYIEQWGSGIQRAVLECANAGLPAPVFEERGFRFRATIGLLKQQAPNLDAVQRKIHETLSSDRGRQGLSSQQIADEVALTTRSIRSHMAKLVAQGLVSVLGKSSRDPYRKYFWKGT